MLNSVTPFRAASILNEEASAVAKMIAMRSEGYEVCYKWCLAHRMGTPEQRDECVSSDSPRLFGPIAEHQRKVLLLKSTVNSGENSMTIITRRQTPARLEISPFSVSHLLSLMNITLC